MADSEFLGIPQDEGLSIGLATPPPEVLEVPNIGVIGIGGAGGNAVNNMIVSELNGVSFFAANTDAQALSKSLAANKIQLGITITKGLGAGANPEVGKASAEESLPKIRELLEGLHLLFITAGMGGGTGTGAAPVIAKLAREMGILTVAVVSKPFMFEGRPRNRAAEAGITELQKYVDTMVVIPNQNLFRIATEKTTFCEAFKMADDVLCQGVRSVTDLVVNPGIWNIDFADLKTVLTTMGRAMMGTGEAEGENRAEIAAEKATTNPLLDNASIKGAKSILVNICGGRDLGITEMDAAMQRINAEVDPDANIIFGTAISEELTGKIRVSLVATGIRRDDVVDAIHAAEKPIIPKVETPIPTISSVIEDVSIGATEPTPEVIPSEPPLIQASEKIPPVRSVSSETMIMMEEVELDAAEAPLPEPALFDEATPRMDMTRMANEPQERPDINVEPQKADANVKPIRSGLFDWGNLMGKPKATPKPKPVPTRKTGVFSAFEEDIDLPEFLRKM